MQILFYQADGNLSAWLTALAAALPQARLRAWQPGDHDPADYALVWKPPPEVLQDRAGLKAVFNLGAGVDALVALLAAHPGLLGKNVRVFRIEDAGMAVQMVQYVAHAVLRHARRFEDYARQQREGRWAPLPTPRAQELTVGVLGLGVLGAQVAAALLALGFRLRGWSRNPRRLPGVDCHHGRAQLARFADGLQVVVNLLPLTADTRGILERGLFARLAPGAALINVARGAHLVEADLLEALASGQLASATLDVFEQEPLPAGHPFWSHPAVTLTPHIAAQTLVAESVRQLADVIAALERGDPVDAEVDLARGY